MASKGKEKKKSLALRLRPKAAKVLLKLLAALPIEFARSLGGAIGYLGWLSNSTHARITRINLAACMPELSEAQRNSLGKKSLIETGKTAAEMGAMFLWTPDRLLKLVERVENLEVLHSAVAEGRGVIVLLPHLGNWEMMGPFLSQQGRFFALYQPPTEAELDALLMESRTRNGMTPLPANQKGVVRLFKELEKGAITAILPDQQPGRKSGGVYAPFFGVQAYTATLLPKIAQKTQAKVLCGIAFRTDKGFVLRFLPLENDVYAKDESEAATAMNQEVEKCIRLAPEQYVWEYKRFRYRPEGEPRFY